ncbi:MAG: hypothetical protein IT437_04160 [Phycisphaerales bacterium]|nr:hypothetical protein [Phycisphaerales bacterium]
MSEDRLRRAEEAIGFGERAAEELAAEVLRLSRRMEELARRLEALERSLGAAEDRGETEV